MRWCSALDSDEICHWLTDPGNIEHFLHLRCHGDCLLSVRWYVLVQNDYTNAVIHERIGRRGKICHAMSLTSHLVGSSCLSVSRTDVAQLATCT